MITIIDKSPIQATGNTSTTLELYLNDPEFESKLFFTHTGATLHYAIMRIDDDYTRVISYNKLVGHYNGTVYEYRFDFNNYIEINNQSIPSLKELSGTSINGNIVDNVKYFSNNNSDKLYYLISSTEIVNNNLRLDNFTKLVNGEIILSLDKTINDVISDQYFYFKFNDLIQPSEVFNYPSIDAINGTRYPITIYDNINIKVIVHTIDDTIYYMLPKELLDPKEYKVYIFTIPCDCIDISIYELVDSTFILRNVIKTINKNINYNDYYYLNDNGIFDILRCIGTKNESSTVTKNVLQIGNRNIATSIINNKQIKQNIGLNITDEQVRSLLVTPLIYSIDNNYNIKEYVLETNTFDSYQGKKLSERNIELTFTDPKIYRKKTNYTIDIFD